MTSNISEWLEKKLECEADVINVAFELSELNGLIFLGGAIKQFKEDYKIFDKNATNEVLEERYNFFITRIARYIKKEYRYCAVNEVLMPIIKNLDKELAFLLYIDMTTMKK